MQSIQAGHAWIGLAVALPVLLLYLGRVRHLSAGHLLAVAGSAAQRGTGAPLATVMNDIACYR